MTSRHDNRIHWLRFAFAGGRRTGKTRLIEQMIEQNLLSGEPLAEAPGGRLFSSSRGRFTVADALPDHDPAYDLALHAPAIGATVLVIDATVGPDPVFETLAYLSAQLKLRHVAVAVNKMDLIGHDDGAFAACAEKIRHQCHRVGLDKVCIIPLSAQAGDNVVRRSGAFPWYSGPTLHEFLETAAGRQEEAGSQPFRLRARWLAHPQPELRGIAGVIASGAITLGDRIRAQPSGKEACVTHLFAEEGPCDVAAAGMPITLVLDPAHEIQPGEILSAPADPAGTADQFEALVTWLHREHLLPGRAYVFQADACSASATVTDIKYRINPANLDHIAAKTLEAGEVGVCNISLDRPVAFDPFADNRMTGSFILLDEATRQPAGGGLIHFALRRAHNIHIQHVDINKVSRSALKGQKACVLWFTGLSGSGKSTIANLVEKKLHALGKHTYLLDGDNVRHGLNRDLGFTDADRVENIRRIAEVAKLMVDAGLIVLTAFISPFRAERQMARKLFPEGEFLEIFVDTPLDVAEARDPKGLYKKARRGELRNFTGIDSPYEAPEAAELRLDTTMHTVEALADQIIARILLR
ncbi:sulfate adenylyltransferase subunit CysN [Rhodocyclaceae bacterium]